MVILPWPFHGIALHLDTATLGIGERTFLLHLQALSVGHKIVAGKNPVRPNSSSSVFTYNDRFWSIVFKGTTEIGIA